jgi:hypothetical protein
MGITFLIRDQTSFWLDKDINMWASFGLKKG